ncbi:MAG TPA: CBS domain-containing protein [Solirubrobacterales bacterium]|jgi:CBS domain-containing protein|nr:CBS domain-containing protein [Solirubrobacterales bacterium]HMY27187.1 CBS domain-containing protein [Solirubrobacterales bacterium]HNA43965.1 CBS domain-containing protein [Solirubrobacterales bacterium]HNC05471.1 CBS domain-containing protein [Solirubrobacterales bacterium]HNE78872.1 CBS domain-containing protein [Solirubrobacterales bacterium]
MPTVAEIMDREPVSVSPEATIQDVIDLLQTNDLPGVPVVDESRKVLGIITDSDLVISNEDSDFHLPHYVNIMGGIVFLESTKHWEERAKKAFAATAADMMTADPITVGPDEPAEHAGRLISERKHNRLPVVDDEGRLVGVVTRVDVLAALTGA